MLLLAACIALVATAGASAHGKPSGTGVVALVSDLTNGTTADDASSLSFNVPSGTTFADLTQLSTQFDPIAGGCGGGSPRFTLHLATGKNVFVYLGPSPSFTGCALNTWEQSGNLIGNNDNGRYDTSQVQSGTQVNTYSGALSLVGSQDVTSIDLTVDSGWFFNPKLQAVLVRDVQINGSTFVTAHGGMNPAQLCRAELKALGTSGFDQKWGKNHNLKNAFGKCVSATAHAR
jgi:hypothetical protein